MAQTEVERFDRSRHALKSGDRSKFNFWWTVATIVVAFVPTLFLPSHGPAAAPAAGPPAAAPDVAADGVEDLIAPVASAVD